jgi:lipopolysaccharide/colanic/teichoic acid biosynthesis glycosyltransferase
MNTVNVAGSARSDGSSAFEALNAAGAEAFGPFPESSRDHVRSVTAIGGTRVRDDLHLRDDLHVDGEVRDDDSGRAYDDLQALAQRIEGSTGKRALDVVLASLGLLFLAPLLLFIAIAIKIDSPGPVFFRQVRYGQGRTFRVFKFRSMTAKASTEVFRQAGRNDARVTNLGKLLRSTNLDELPQLFNVVLGDMSLVGPRPHPTALDDRFATEIPGLMNRYLVRPGITGWAQVNGWRGETATTKDMAARVAHDLWYLSHWSLALDIVILWRTLFNRAAWQNAY